MVAVVGQCSALQEGKKGSTLPKDLFVNLSKDLLRKDLSRKDLFLDLRKDMLKKDLWKDLWKYLWKDLWKDLFLNLWKVV